ncbi:iron chelate uptake ABC transporter family permease subunit [Streptomyces lavendulae]|uniref:iron chelate uptake ABC transporter family permease subunit n=1 Tax=Streptomyces lavendulae TaxID=1914 RepID=UPI0037142537
MHAAGAPAEAGAFPVTIKSALGEAVIKSRPKRVVLTAYVNGSLAARCWDDSTTIWAVLLVCLPCAVLLARPPAPGEMGDDLSTGLGVDPGRIRTAAVLLSTVLPAGALLLVLAGLAAQQLPLFDNLPVGIYTMAVAIVYSAVDRLRDGSRRVLPTRAAPCPAAPRRAATDSQ